MWRRIHYRTENSCGGGFTTGLRTVVVENSLQEGQHYEGGFTAGKRRIVEEDSFTTGQRTVVKEDSLQDTEQLW